MENKLNVDAIISKIHLAEDATLKALTDIVALKISKGPFDKGAEVNIGTAEKITSEYISDHYQNLEEFHHGLTTFDGGIKGIQALAATIYQRYTTIDHLDFETVKNSISSKKDITLKTITDLVAYKIAESAEDQGVDLNFISAQTFVAEYVSKHFKNREELENKIGKLGKDLKGLSFFAEKIYHYFVNKDK